MGLSMEDKQAVVTEVAAQVAKAQAIVLAEYRGLEVGHMTELRRKARGSGVYLRVLKNTLARRAVKDTPFSQLADSITGPLIYGISQGVWTSGETAHRVGGNADGMANPTGSKTE